MRGILGIFAAFLVALCISCAGPTKTIESGDRVIIGGIKPVIQDTNGCLPACLEMVMRYNGIDIDKRKIADEIQGSFGTSWDKVYPFLRKHGFVLMMIHVDSIRRNIDERVPVIVSGRLANAGQLGHVVLVVGYDQKKYHIIDPMRGAVTREYESELKEWNRGRDCWIIMKK